MGKIVKCKNCYATYDLGDNEGGCPFCGVEYSLENQDDNVDKSNDNKVENSKNKPSKAVKVFKAIGSVLLLILKCVGYLVYCLCLVWLFTDLFDSFTNKKK